MIIVLTNDDGYQSEGILTLEEVLTKAGHEVWVCAPAEERSAQSHAMTLKGTVRFVRYDERHYYCSGTPADCILYGMHGQAIPVKPDIIISGINHGYNASTDILYSGTVGAASEAALRGFKAIAISARRDYETDRYPFEESATFLADHLEEFLPLCNEDVILNINVPPKPNGKWRVGKIGQLVYLDVAERSTSLKRTSYDASHTKVGLAYGNNSPDINGVFIGDELTLSLSGVENPTLRDDDDEADYKLLGKGYISVTPLQVQPMVDSETIEVLKALVKDSSNE
ncbi:MAG: 5'/3'-nucleotidase SurE [Sphaerochaetaceae bacterium]